MSYSDSKHSGTSNNSNPVLLDGERAPLTDDEIKTVKAIRAAFKATDSAYCCSGRVPVEVKRPTVLYAHTPATFATEWVNGETPILAG